MIFKKIRHDGVQGLTNAVFILPSPPPQFIFFHRAARGDEAKTHKLLLFRGQLQQLATRLIPGEAGPSAN